jgi:hypothetical protein
MRQEAFKFCLDTRNNGAVPWDPACPEHLSVRSLTVLPLWPYNKGPARWRRTWAFVPLMCDIEYIFGYLLEPCLKSLNLWQKKVDNGVMFPMCVFSPMWSWQQFNVPNVCVLTNVKVGQQTDWCSQWVFTKFSSSSQHVLKDVYNSITFYLISFAQRWMHHKIIVFPWQFPPAYTL